MLIVFGDYLQKYGFVSSSIRYCCLSTLSSPYSRTNGELILSLNESCNETNDSNQIGQRLRYHGSEYWINWMRIFDGNERPACQSCGTELPVKCILTGCRLFNQCRIEYVFHNLYSSLSKDHHGNAQMIEFLTKYYLFKHICVYTYNVCYLVFKQILSN